nr:hypothetical protein BaRGS_007553 [Batillaria attramentaria]
MPGDCSKGKGEPGEIKAGDDNEDFIPGSEGIPIFSLLSFNSAAALMSLSSSSVFWLQKLEVSAGGVCWLCGPIVPESGRGQQVQWVEIHGRGQALLEPT